MFDLVQKRRRVHESQVRRFGNKDDYKTMALEKRLLEAGAIEEEEKAIEEEGKGDEQIDEEDVMRHFARRKKRGFHKGEFATRIAILID